MNLVSLIVDGFVTVSYPYSLRTCVEKAMTSWQHFYDLPLAEKQQLAGGDRTHDFGYMFRKDTGPCADSKELFHVSRGDVRLLRRKAHHLAREATLFIDAIDELLMASEELILNFAISVEEQYHLLGFRDAIKENIRNWTFRYLHYLTGDILAHPHVDRGSFTLHLYESAPGGEYLDYKDTTLWHPFPLDHKETVIFPSMGMQYRSRGALTALCHRVVSDGLVKQTGRSSMVAFIDASRDKYNGNTRLQELPPGFNYGMPFEEFEKLFKG